MTAPYRSARPAPTGRSLAEAPPAPWWRLLGAWWRGALRCPWCGGLLRTRQELRIRTHLPVIADETATLLVRNFLLHAQGMFGSLPANVANPHCGRLAARLLGPRCVTTTESPMRCPTCFKRVAQTVWRTPYFNISPPEWDNWLSRAAATAHARAGLCPWCGRRTTTPARTLLARFEPNLRRYDRGID